MKASLLRMSMTNLLLKRHIYWLLIGSTLSICIGVFRYDIINPQPYPFQNRL